MDTILNTYCEVEFLCKDNSPNWIGFFLFFLLYWFIKVFSVIFERVVLKSSPAEFQLNINKTILNIIFQFIVFFIISFILGMLI